ncbi:hypothetical protein BC829DRAFT_385788, partial [Chytridium lagenaria]
MTFTIPTFLLITTLTTRLITSIQSFQHLHGAYHRSFQISNTTSNPNTFINSIINLPLMTIKIIITLTKLTPTKPHLNLTNLNKITLTNHNPLSPPPNPQPTPSTSLNPPTSLSNSNSSVSATPQPSQPVSSSQHHQASTQTLLSTPSSAASPPLQTRHGHPLSTLMIAMPSSGCFMGRGRSI